VTRTTIEYFEQLYRHDQDPWGFDSRWYEQRKFALTVASLPDKRYGAAFEPGCSIGALTERLAPRCERLLAVDHVSTPLDQAIRRLRRFPHVRVEQRVLPEDWPPGPFDLLVLSEFCYYFDAAELDDLIERARQSLEANAVVVAVHWRGDTDYPLTAAETHRILANVPGFGTVTRHVDEQFLLDVWRYRP
jgi:cyclopropane fatty-acyl-phospholipid synthase-like methyltransferase